MANFQNIVSNTFRENAEKAFYAGIKAADPEIALSNAIKINPIPAISKKGKFIVVSVGKAACKMANCLINNLLIMYDCIKYDYQCVMPCYYSVSYTHLTLPTILLV